MNLRHVPHLSIELILFPRPDLRARLLGLGIGIGVVAGAALATFFAERRHVGDAAKSSVREATRPKARSRTDGPSHTPRRTTGSGAVAPS